MNQRSSFTAADAMPIKVLQNAELIDTIVNQNIIPPHHLLLTPTNRCNLNCSFCLCKNEDKTLEMSLFDIATLASVINPHYTKACTVSGGGEPLMFPYLMELFKMLHRKRVDIGMVTNGVLLHKQPKNMLDYLTWCRISNDDDRKMTAEYAEGLIKVIQKSPTVDWAFSYVVSRDPDIENIKSVILLADMLNCTHVRLVSDFFDVDNVPVERVKNELTPFLKGITIPIIFQEKNKPECGSKCRICYLKPVIAPDMYIYACCGASFAMGDGAKLLPKEFRLGHVLDLPRITKEMSTKPFPMGDNCIQCYYMEYNRLLDVLLSDVKHGEFL
jgi:organic radical activating enzyme